MIDNTKRYVLWGWEATLGGVVMQRSVHMTSLLNVVSEKKEFTHFGAPGMRPVMHEEDSACNDIKFASYIRCIFQIALKHRCALRTTMRLLQRSLSKL